MTNPSKPPVMEYSSPQLTPANRPSILAALFLCLPGSACWFLFLMEAVFGVNMDIDYSAWFAWLVMIAMLTAVISIFFYAAHWRYLKYWYVIINLCINVAGLLFASVPILLR